MNANNDRPHFTELADAFDAAHGALKGSAMLDVFVHYPDAPASLLERGAKANQVPLDEIVQVDEASRSPFVELGR